MKLTLHPYDLHLRHTFTISRESTDIQKTLIVELEENGISGYGEATANSYYGITVEKMMAVLEGHRSAIESYELHDPAQFWADMQPHLQDYPFIQCALDIAANDLHARLQGKPLYQVWGLKLENLPLTNYTIGIADINKMVAKMEEMPWPLYKIKLGTNQDVEIVEALRKHTTAVFRVDANCAWTPEQTIEYAPRLKELGVEFIEQPLVYNDWEGLKKVYAESVLPIIADESCRTEEDVQKCHGHFHGINIKLVKCGGLTPARRMIQEARQLGMQVMCGCMTESSVGISAIAQLLPLLDYVDMDGALLLKNDPADGVQLVAGKAIFPDRAGTGVVLK